MTTDVVIDITVDTLQLPPILGIYLHNGHMVNVTESNTELEGNHHCHLIEHKEKTTQV